VVVRKSYCLMPGEKFDAVKFVEANHAAGGAVAQLFHSMIRDLDDDGLRRLCRRAEELDVMLEVHGGGALGKWSKFEERESTITSRIGCFVVILAWQRCIALFWKKAGGFHVASLLEKCR